MFFLSIPYIYLWQDYVFGIGCSFVYLFVCLLATLLGQLWTDYDGILRRGPGGNRNKWLDFILGGYNINVIVLALVLQDVQNDSFRVANKTWTFSNERLHHEINYLRVICILQFVPLDSINQNKSLTPSSCCLFHAYSHPYRKSNVTDCNLHGEKRISLGYFWFVSRHKALSALTHQWNGKYNK